MQQRFKVSGSVGAAALSLVTLATLSACGGGGNSGPATVTSMSINAPKYGVQGVITVAGTNLSNLTLTAPGCRKLARLSTAPTVSTETIAYFSCTPSGAYTSSVVASYNGTTLNTQTLTVPAPIVTMAVSGAVIGNIVFNLRGNQAPITVDNFLDYVNSGFYNNLIFHRVVSNFVVQGGGYGQTSSGTLPTVKTPTYSPIALETTGGSNVQWTAAMARTSDANSATSQFFFNLANNASILDPSSSTAGYAVFADVSSSAAVIQAIAAAPCTALLSGGLPLSDGSCVPVPNVLIISATQSQ